MRRRNCGAAWSSAARASDILGGGPRGKPVWPFFARCISELTNDDISPKPGSAMTPGFAALSSLVVVAIAALETVMRKAGYEGLTKMMKQMNHGPQHFYLKHLRRGFSLLLVGHALHEHVVDGLTIQRYVLCPLAVASAGSACPSRLECPSHKI
jgi:hypothetical protein